jgi:hypothetical protein
LDNRQGDEYTRHRKPNLERLTEMVVFFTEGLPPWKTKMNKLLFMPISYCLRKLALQ